jgi:hypothetical protein
MSQSLWVLAPTMPSVQADSIPAAISPVAQARMFANNHSPVTKPNPLHLLVWARMTGGR